MTVGVLGRDGPGVASVDGAPVSERTWYLLPARGCPAEVEWKFDGIVSTDTPYPAAHQLGPKALLDAGDGGNLSPQFAYDFATGGAFFFYASTRNTPALWAPGSIDVFQGYSAPTVGTFGDPDAWRYWGAPFDPALDAHDIANPWAQSGTGYPRHPPPGYPGLDADIRGARSGWRWRRGLRLKWTNQDPDDWGYIELVIGGRLLCQGDSGPLGWSYRSYGGQRSWFELALAPFSWQTPPITVPYAEQIPPNGDSPPPWGDDPRAIIGWERGPFSKGKPAVIQPEAMVGRGIYESWNAGGGWVTTVFRGIDSWGVSGSNEMPAPETDTESWVEGDAVTINHAMSYESSWEAISTIQMRVYYPIAPGHTADELEFVWDGAHPAFDAFSEISLSANFYPVVPKQYGQALPEMPDHGIVRSRDVQYVGKVSTTGS